MQLNCGALDGDTIPLFAIDEFLHLSTGTLFDLHGMLLDGLPKLHRLSVLVLWLFRPSRTQ